MRAFIIRPFGVKKGIDFDRVESDLIGPALDALKFSGRTTGEILKSGNIRTDMFQELLVADLVVADISTNNANAFYELGIRHALRDRHTFLLRSRTREPKPEAETKIADATAPPAAKTDLDEVPFDLRTDRYLAYDPEKPNAILDTLIVALRETIESKTKDSPVFFSLPALKAPDRSAFTPIPQDFGEEVVRALESQQREKLALLALEVSGLPWETEGLRTIGRAQFKAKNMGDAKSTWEAVRRLEENDIEANLLLTTIYAQLGNITESNLCVDRVTRSSDAKASDLAEAYALLARNHKNLWLAEWSQLNDPQERRLQAFSSPLLLKTYHDYRNAFRQDLNAFYPGINALAMLVVFSELAKSFSEQWNGRYSDDSTAALELTKLHNELQSLKSAMDFCITANKQRSGDTDRWLNITKADFVLLTGKRPTQVENEYRIATVGLDEMAKDSIRRQLQIYLSLDVLTENTNGALKALGQAKVAPKPAVKEPPEYVILFTGHRVDAPSRAKPRFPAECEERARAEIKKAVENIRNITKGRILGIAGAAAGGDILFHEVCRDLGIETKICLALPADQYIAASVKSSGGDWERRFYDLGANGKDIPVLAETPEFRGWLRMKRDYDIWQRNNLWELTHALVQDASHVGLVALWDGQKGDGPGGTEHMVRIARERGAQIDILDTNRICDSA